MTLPLHNGHYVVVLGWFLCDYLFTLKGVVSVLFLWKKDDLSRYVIDFCQMDLNGLRSDPEILIYEILRSEILRSWDLRSEILRSTDWIFRFLLRAKDQRFLWSCFIQICIFFWKKKCPKLLRTGLHKIIWDISKS